GNDHRCRSDIDVWRDDLVDAEGCPQVRRAIVLLHSPVIPGNAVFRESTPQRIKVAARRRQRPDARHDVANLEMANTRPDGDDAANAFVAEHRWIFDLPDKLIRDDVLIRAGANRAVEQLAERVIIAHSWLRNLFDDQKI